jgi:hypothetical protein
MIIMSLPLKIVLSMFVQVIYITSMHFRKHCINFLLQIACEKLGAKVQLYINQFKSISHVLNKPSIWSLNYHYHTLSNLVSELQKYIK